MSELIPPKDRLILVVDDDADNLKLISTALQHEGYRVEEAQSGEEALERLKTISPDLILLDINMPGISGLETLRQLRRREDYVSVIFVTARTDADDIIIGLDSGADDYVCKPYDPYVLLARVRAQLRIKDLNDRLAQANRTLQELVDIDDLTGLFNMRSMYDRLDKEIYRARRYGRGVCAVMMDMDNFKTVNDTNDHLFGSYVLGEVGKMISETIRQVDFAARYGGDEFLIVLTETNADGARAFAERIRKKIGSRLFAKDGASMHLTASLGICCTFGSAEHTDGRTLVRQADNALYEAKRAGKNCVRAYSKS
ncbi:MAG: diguanylate cyclase [Bdellovibrionaceae bacterium]|nr:diguanylate cyclase [Pseudobdellovibrionaceae bacterium]